MFFFLFSFVCVHVCMHACMHHASVTSAKFDETNADTSRHVVKVEKVNTHAHNHTHSSWRQTFGPKMLFLTSGGVPSVRGILKGRMMPHQNLTQHPDSSSRCPICGTLSCFMARMLCYAKKKSKCWHESSMDNIEENCSGHAPRS